jgi:Zn finger protein HypA/HybF involved in hydrogenase expression
VNTAPEQTDGYVLCQDCGHLEPFTIDRHQGRESCPKCSGDFCGCTACSELARLAIQFQQPIEGDEVSS